MDEEIPYAAERLDAAVTAIERPVVDLYIYSRRTRRLLVAMLVSLAFDVAVSAALTVFAIQAHDTARRAHDLTIRVSGLSRDRALAACAQRNQFKTLDRERWQKALSLLSPAQLAQFRSFRDYIGSADTLENCGLLSDNPGVFLDPTPKPTSG